MARDGWISHSEDMVVEVIHLQDHAFVSHRRVFEHKLRPEIKHILLVDAETGAAILHRRHHDRWSGAMHVSVDDAIEDAAKDSA